MEAAGIRRSQRHALVGDYQLETLLQQTELHQDWLAHHAHVKGSPRRVRIYPRAAKTSGATRAVQERAAENEFRLLERLDHPSIPRAEGFPPSERGDCLVFRHDPDAERLDLFLERTTDALDFGERIDLLRDLAEAVQHAHGRNVHHRTLSPQTVLVSRPRRLRTDRQDRRLAERERRPGHEPRLAHRPRSDPARGTHG